MPRPSTPQARLGWVLDGEWSFDAAGPNRAAADSVVRVASSAIAAEHQALVTGFVMLAEAVDADPTNAALWGQYRAAEIAVREVIGGDGDDQFSKLLAELSANVRDTEDAGT